MLIRGGEVVNKARLCRLTGRSRQQLDRWVLDGCPVVEMPKDKGGEWKFNTAQVFAWAAKRSPDEQAEVIDLDTERARLAKEQADSYALKNDVLRRELLPAEEVIAGWQAAIGRARSLLLGIPTSISASIILLARQHEDADLAARMVRQLLIDQIDAALVELTNTEVDEDELEEPDGTGDSLLVA